jgi:hypothetical protein
VGAGVRHQRPKGESKLSSIDPARGAGASATAGRRNVGAVQDHSSTRPTRHRRTTETKAAFKTTELITYIAAVVAVLIAGMVLDQNDAGGLGARQVWLYVTILTVGYMISRGLAKSGSRDAFWDDDNADGRTGQ